MTKKFLAKVYDGAGDYVSTIPVETLMSKIRFTSQINGGQKELNLDLNLAWDNPPTYASVENYVRVYAVDTDNTTGRLIYTGKITEVIPTLSGGQSKIILTCLGLGSLMKVGLYNASHTADDPSDIVDAIIADNQTDYPAMFGVGWIGSDAVPDVRTGGQVDTVSTTVTFAFAQITWAESMKEVIRLTAASWYWFIDGGGDFIFKEKPATATHTFTIGKDVDSIFATNSIEDIINYATVDYDGGTVTANDATSISAYGKRETYKDSSASTSTSGTAQNIADQLVAENKDPKKNIKITLNANYDLESIKCGETCKVQNLKKDSTVVSSNMQIVSIDYNDGVYATLELEQLTDFGSQLENFVASQS